MTHARTRRSVSRAASLTLVAAALAGCGNGATSGTEARHALRAADQCAKQVGVERVDSPQGPAIGEQEKPFYAATVVGVSGEPPVALGFGDDTADTSVTFAIVPGAADPGKDTTFGDASAASVNASFLTVPRAKIVETERCLGGSAAG